VVQICLNLSRRHEFSTYLDNEFIGIFVKSLKILFSSKLSPPSVKHFSLVALTNFAFHCRPARQIILGNDLIDLFNDVGIADERLNVKYAGLLNIISNEESSIYKLLDLGTQKMFVSLQDSLTNCYCEGQWRGISQSKKERVQKRAKHSNTKCTSKEWRLSIFKYFWGPECKLQWRRVTDNLN
jgi:hypothetical protein